MNNCKKYELVPPKIAESDTAPWVMVCVDLLGPFTIRILDKKTHSLLALTMIDPATG
jgi:hypothetical protein